MHFSSSLKVRSDCLLDWRSLRIRTMSKLVTTIKSSSSTTRTLIVLAKVSRVSRSSLFVSVWVGVCLTAMEELLAALLAGSHEQLLSTAALLVLLKRTVLN